MSLLDTTTPSTTAGESAVTPSRLCDVCGVPVAAMTMAEVLDKVDEAITQSTPLLLAVVNGAKLVNMKRDASLRRAVLSADIILADGMSVVWASRILGRRLPERVAGIDLMHEILRRGNDRAYRIYLLGATDEVIADLTSIIARDFPGVVVVGARNGYFTAAEEEQVASEVADARADVLFVGTNSPKKELFLARWSKEMNVSVCHGVGGAFDVLSGKTKRAPERWQGLGLEWLYRVVQEPRRMWRRYLVTNVLLCGMVIKESLFGGGRRGV